MAGLVEARLRAARRGGPEITFVADGGRLWGPRWFEEMVREAIHFRREGIVAVGLGGDETAYPTRAFERGFDLARAGGLGTVAHAGEGTSSRSVREAVEILQVPRVGHGIAAARDPSLLAFLARRGTLLEICPTSNLMTRAVRSADHHPLRRIVESGVRVALGSDDRTIFGTTLRGEIDRAVREIGLPPEWIPRLMMNAVRGSFAPARIKRELIRKIRSASAGRSARNAAGVASA
jgi:aminodeoxyfutalosine deaminase